jgi:hypothetical protein
MSWRITVGAAPLSASIAQSAMGAPTPPGAERGMVNGMFPDFRFVLGASLAIAVLAVGALGLVTSIQLAREARMAPLEDARSLAFAGHAEWNQFYDPDSARRFEGLAGKTEAPLAEARHETPAETSVAAPPVIAPAAEPPAVMIAAPPAEQVASAPATLSAPDPFKENQTPTQEPALAQPRAAGGPPQDSAPPTPRPRPKAHFRRKIARAHLRRVAPVSQQTLPDLGFPLPIAPSSSSSWPGYDDNQFTGATTKKNTGKLTGTLANHPQ